MKKCEQLVRDAGGLQITNYGMDYSYHVDKSFNLDQVNELVNYLI